MAPGSNKRSGYCGNTGSGSATPFTAGGAGRWGELIKRSLIVTSIRNRAAVAIGSPSVGLDSQVANDKPFLARSADGLNSQGKPGEVLNSCIDRSPDSLEQIRWRDR